MSSTNPVSETMIDARAAQVSLAQDNIKLNMPRRKCRGVMTIGMRYHGSSIRSKTPLTLVRPLISSAKKASIIAMYSDAKR